MTDDLRIAIEGSGPKRTCRLAGHLDTHTYQSADSELEPVLADPSVSLLVLDLSELEYISSAGLRTVFRARKSLGSRGGKVLVANPQPQIRKVFDLVKAVPFSEIFSSTAEADAYLDAMQKRVLSGDDD
ncbi:MAG: STAS domain-containing protein [Lysobacteraceae bacterium]|jgi:anti-anti-sigma factor|uniref:STAS domain-containing protein n=1 Tax=Silanimonas sp. TaxID=1929290 RepID=UPI0022C1C75A|nr:STAS domain-containing protein [Silanimonas sp.]MCZ8115860.1 STAS domain-containing protein [Silanimonas sp.]